MINSAINSVDKFKNPKEILNTSGETIFPLFLLSIFQYCTETGKESLRFLSNIFFFTHHIFSSFNICSFLVEMIKLCLPHALVPCEPRDPDPGSCRLFLSLYLHLSLLPPVITRCSKATVLARSREGML